jgi:hypothetical protein
VTLSDAVRGRLADARTPAAVAVALRAEERSLGGMDVLVAWLCAEIVSGFRSIGTGWGEGW